MTFNYAERIIGCAAAIGLLVSFAACSTQQNDASSAQDPTHAPSAAKPAYAYTDARQPGQPIRQQR